MIDLSNSIDIFKQDIAYDKDIMSPVWDCTLESMEVSEEIAKNIFYYLYDEKYPISSTGTYLEKELRQNLKEMTTFSQDNLELSKKMLQESFKKVNDSKEIQRHYKTYKQQSFFNKRQWIEKVIKAQTNFKETSSLWKNINVLVISEKLKTLFHSVRETLNDFTHKEKYLPTQKEESDIAKTMKHLSIKYKVTIDEVANFDFEIEIPKLQTRLNETIVNLKNEKKSLENLKNELNKITNNKSSKKQRKNSKLLQNKEDLSELKSAISFHEDKEKEFSLEIETIKKELEVFLSLRKDFASLHEKFLDNQKYFDEYYENLKKVSKVFEDISSLSGLGWDLSKSILSNKKWIHLEKFSKILEQLETLQNLAKTIGRMKYSDEYDLENILYKEIVIEKKRVISSLAKSEVFGIEQSDNIQRVLPNELSYLSSSQTKNIFYAKFLEKKLLTYKLSGWIDETIKKEVEKEKNIKKKKKEKGPIIVNIDTSGSMNGKPEKMAKALTLAMVKIALKEKRECYLITFSSLNEIKEYELTKGDNALNNLLDFLMYSFGGGTDFETPLQRGLEILERDTFSKADILMVTDGQAGVSSQFSKKLILKKKEINFKITTVIIGSAIEKDNFSDKIINFNTLLS